jgi:hypothetical protein
VRRIDRHQIEQFPSSAKVVTVTVEFAAAAAFRAEKSPLTGRRIKHRESLAVTPTGIGIAINDSKRPFVIL